MALKDLIYKNIVLQIKNNIQLADCQKELNKLQQEAAANTGGMNVLAELYKEETGEDLQKAINTDPEFADMIRRAEAEARGSQPTPVPMRPVAVVSPQPLPATPPQPLPATPPETPRLRRTADNMKVAVPVEKVEKEIAPQQKERTRAPVQIVIDDSPPTPGRDTEDD